MTGSRREKDPACSEMPAPVGEVVLVELLNVSVAMVVALRLELVELTPAVGAVEFWETA